MTGPPTGTSRFRVLCAGVCAVVLTVGIARFSFTPLLPVMRLQTGLDSADAGWLATANYAGYLLGALVAARVRDGTSRFALYRLGLVLALVSTLATGLTMDFRLWLLLRLVAGWSGTSGMLVASGLVMNWLVQRGRRPELGVHFSGFGLGIVLSGALVAAMDGHLPWNLEWIALGMAGVVFLVPAWAWMPRPAPVDAVREPAPPAAAPSARWIAWFSVAYFCGGIGFVVTATFVVDIVSRTGGATVPGHAVWLIVGAAAVPACSLFDRIAQRIGQMNALTLAYALQTASIALILLGRSAPALVTGAALFGGTVIGTVSLTLAIIGRRFPSNPGQAMARLTLAYGGAQILGPVVAGQMSQASGSYRGALALAVGIGVLGTALSRVNSRQRERA